MSDQVRRVASQPDLGSPAITAAELEEFYRDFFLPLVRRAVRRHGMTTEDAGDIVQDAFILALGKLDPERNPKAWLYQVVDHLAANWQRKQIRRARLLEHWQASIETAEDEELPT